MEPELDTLTRVRNAAQRKVLFLPHALRQMLRPDRMINTADVRHVVSVGEVIEDYPDDVRGQSCLLCAVGIDGRPLHVVCAPTPDYLAIITAYVPEQGAWSDDFKKRVKA